MKILYVTTISNTVNAFLIPHIRMLIDQGHHVELAFNIIQEVDPELIELGCIVHKLEFERSPLKKNNYIAYKKLKNLIKSEHYDLIHTHTPVASACVRIACKKLNNVKVIYTAHGFHFYKGAPLKNWLIYYPIERWLAKYTHLLLTINDEDYFRAKKSFKVRKVGYIPGVGIDTKKLDEIAFNKLEKRKDFGIPSNAFVLISVGELNKNKNHETVIKAIAMLNNPNIYYIICGEGKLRGYLTKLVHSLGMTEKVKLAGFRTDVNEIYKCADLFIFPSIREGLSVSLMEAMVCGLPVVCSKIRGNNDLIEDKKGGFLVKPNDIEGFKNAINSILVNSNSRKNFINHNYNKIMKFDYENVLAKLEAAYSQIN